MRQELFGVTFGGPGSKRLPSRSSPGPVPVVSGCVAVVSLTGSVLLYLCKLSCVQTDALLGFWELKINVPFPLWARAGAGC